VETSTLISSHHQLLLPQSSSASRFTAGRPLVRRDVVHVQDLLNNIVNLSEHESANFFLPLGRREQNESRDHGANVDDNAAKFVRRARLEFYGFWHDGCPFER
jgi:hypothetical protein